MARTGKLETDESAMGVCFLADESQVLYVDVVPDPDWDRDRVSVPLRIDRRDLDADRCPPSLCPRCPEGRFRTRMGLPNPVE